MDHKEQKTLPNNVVIAGVIKALETVPRVVLPVRGPQHAALHHRRQRGVWNW